MKINTSSKSGFTLVEIMIVVAIIGLLAAIAIPNFVHARTTAQMNACINNLRQIDAAIQQWALENNKGATATVLSTDITVYLGRGTTGGLGNVVCPQDGTKTFATSYTIVDSSTKPVCQKLPGSTPGVSHFIN